MPLSYIPNDPLGRETAGPGREIMEVHILHRRPQVHRVANCGHFRPFQNLSAHLEFGWKILKTPPPPIDPELVPSSNCVQHLTDGLTPSVRAEFRIHSERERSHCTISTEFREDLFIVA
jgi:hypothetical protein